MYVRVASRSFYHVYIRVGNYIYICIYGTLCANSLLGRKSQCYVPCVSVSIWWNINITKLMVYYMFNHIMQINETAYILWIPFKLDDAWVMGSFQIICIFPGPTYNFSYNWHSIINYYCWNLIILNQICNTFIF